jgi:DNA-binding SARP family transcriptional activator/ABC-type transport system substrate-binding protein
VEFLILGPLEVRDGYRVVPLGGAKPRAALAILLLNANQVVSRDRLIDGLWGDEPPASASHTLNTYVSRLRHAMAANGEASRMLSRTPGYVLTVREGELDLGRFQALLEGGRGALGGGEFGRAALMLREALALFRGPPLDDLTYAPFAQAEIGRLEELRLGALEDRIEADLALGRHVDLAGELADLVARHPFRERLCGQLMMALYRCGRQADALAAYQRTRKRLADELGVDPGSSLRLLEGRILRQDSDLELSSVPVPVRGPHTVQMPDLQASAVAVIESPPSPAGVATGGTSPLPVEGGRSRLLSGRRARIGKVAALPLVLIAALVATLIPAMLRGGTPASGVNLLDAKTGRVVAHFAVDAPAEITYADGVFWVLNLTPMSFVGIDARSHRVVARFASPVEDVGYFAADGNDLWVTSNGGPTLARVDIPSGRVVSLIPLSETDTTRTAPVAVGAGSVWVGRPDVGEVLRIDRQTGAIQHRFSHLPTVWGFALGDGKLWVRLDGPPGGLTWIDPRTNEVGPTVGNLGRGPFVEAGGGFVWTANESGGTVFKLAPSGQVVATYRTGEGARKVSFSNGVVWVANQDAGTVTRIDAVTGEQRTYPMGHPVQTVAAGADLVAVAVGTGRTYEDVFAGLKGNVARFLLPGYLTDPSDPALADIRSNPWMAQVERATCAMLLNYPDAGGPGGARLRPEIAAAMPQVSADGLTYTFTVRPGFRFSPPSNQPVAAEAVRYSIERALSPKLGTNAPGPEVVGDIAGEQAFREGSAQHISGLRAAGDHVTLTLTRPSADFLERLALPFFCTVPTGTLAVPRGLLPSELATAGPYYMDPRRVNGEYFILRRNPNYAGSRPHFFDAFAFREGVDPGQSVDRVKQGTWDHVSQDDPLFLPGGAVEHRWGPDGTDRTRGGLEYVGSPLPVVHYLAFNASRPLFSDSRLRQAVAWALDRDGLAAIRGEAAADELVPPTVRGYEDRFLFSGGEPDVGTARALVRNAGGAAVMAVQSECEPCKQVARAVVAQLAPAGIAVHIKEMDDTSAAALAGAPVDLVELATMLPYPDGASFLTAVLGGDVPLAWLPPTVAQRVARVTAMAGPGRDAAAAALAEEIGWDVVPVTAFGYETMGELFSARIGCRLSQQIGSGVDLAALCLGGGR